MSKPYQIGWCPLCNQGWQVVRRERHSHHLFIRCEECLTEWDSPAAAKDPKVGTFQTHESEGYATREDLSAHSWTRYVKNLDNAKETGTV